MAAPTEAMPLPVCLNIVSQIIIITGLAITIRGQVIARQVTVHLVILSQVKAAQATVPQLLVLQAAEVLQAVVEVTLAEALDQDNFKEEIL